MSREPQSENIAQVMLPEGDRKALAPECAADGAGAGRVTVTVTGGGGGVTVTVTGVAVTDWGAVEAIVAGLAGVSWTGVAPVANEHPTSVTAANAATATRLRRGFFVMSASLS